MATGWTKRSSLFLVLMGCVAAPVEAPAPSVVLVPDEGGFAVAGSALRIDWGREERGAVRALSKGFGEPLAIDTCGDLRAYGFAEVTAYFRAGDLRGWQTDTGSAGATCV